MSGSDNRIRKFTRISLAYPVALILVDLGLNAFAFRVVPPVVTLPPPQVVCALVISAALLIVNHTWTFGRVNLVSLMKGYNDTSNLYIVLKSVASDLNP